MTDLLPGSRIEHPARCRLTPVLSKDGMPSDPTGDVGTASYLNLMYDPHSFKVRDELALQWVCKSSDNTPFYIKGLYL